MKIKILFTALFLILFIGLNTSAQVKIGYTNVELILAYMPEAKKMDQQLQTYQNNLAQKLKVKDDYVKTKYSEYLELKQKEEQGVGVEKADLKTREDELLKLDEELRRFTQDSEDQLIRKRSELLEPILKKLQDAIDNVAKTEGFKYILNQTTSAGVSTILFGPEEHDVTERVMKILNIQIPQ